MAKLPKMKKVTSFSDLRAKAATDPRYNKLGILAAGNLGHQPRNFTDAMNSLQMEAMESGLGEEGIVDEINFCIDMVKEV